MKKQGTNQYKNKYKTLWGLKTTTWWSVVLLLILCIIVAFWGRYSKSRSTLELLSPIPKGYIPEKIILVKEVIAVDRNQIDAFIDKYKKRYVKNDTQYSYLKQLIHCLLYYESKHGIVKTNGDNGLAGGIAQFHQATWVRMRKQMLKQNLIEEIGSRYND